MPSVPIKWPFRGLSDDLAFSEQPEGTSPDLQNVRNIDRKTGRTRGGQRACLSKFNASVLDSNAVIEINQVTYDNRLLTYAEHTDTEEEEVKSVYPPTPSTVRNVRTDRQGNVYATNGRAGLVKYNPSMAEPLWTIDLPVSEEAHIVRALFVDELDFIYVAVSQGGDSTTSKMWMYEQLPDNEVAQVWEIETGARVEDIIVKGELLYTSQNFVDRLESKIVVYEGIDAVPKIAWERKTAFPINSMSISPKDGSIYTAHEESQEGSTGFRKFNPRTRDFYPTSVDFTPRDITDFESRIWSWYDASTLKEDNPIIEEGDQIFTWRDISGNQRHLFADTGITDPPTYNERGIADRPSVRFSSNECLVSGINPGTSHKFRDQHRSLWPSYTNAGTGGTDDSAFCLFMVVRIARNTSEIGTILYQTQEDPNNSSNDFRALLANRTHGTSTGNSSQSDGFITVYDYSTSGDSGNSGSARMPEEGQFVLEETDTVLLTYYCDGMVNTLTNSADHSKWRVNGQPLDRYTSNSSVSSKAVYLGRSDDGTNTGTVRGSWKFFVGDIAEIIVFDRKTPTSTAPVVMQSDQFGFDPGNDGDLATGDQSDDEMTKIEGYLCHKYGIFQQLPLNGESYPHPYGLDSSSNAGPPPDGATGAAALLNTFEPMVAKYESSGDLQWVANETSAGGTVTGGVGFGVVAGNTNGIVYSHGPAGPSGSTVRIRRITDNGATFAATGGDTWTDTMSSNPTPLNGRPKMDVDEFNSLYFPYNASVDNLALRVYESDGTKVVQLGLLSNQEVTSIAVDDNIPVYSNSAIKVAENIYMGSEAAASTSLHRIRLVKSTLSDGSPRTTKLVGVGGDEVKEFTSSGITTPTNNTGRSTVINASAQYVQSAQAFGEVFFTDGQTYTVYNPKDSDVEDWLATSAGKVPERQKLIEIYRGRMVLARGVEDPHNWHMSEEGNPYGWDVFPPVQTSKMAVEGNNAGAGKCPDIINTLIPYNDDLLLMGGDHSIYRLTGNPAAGAELDLVSDVTGMSFGRPWCKDPNGVVYFFGSRGGVYRMMPGAPPQRVTVDNIERRMQGVNLSTHYIRMAYNYRDEGVHVFQCAYGTATVVDHWFFDLKREAWFQDTFGATTLQPKSVFVSDGDQESDRVMLIGCSDGFVRKWDESALDDDGTRCDSYVTMLMNAPGQEQEIRYSHMRVTLAADQDGCDFQFFAQDDAEAVGDVKAQGHLAPGMNPFNMERMRGSNPFLRLRNANLNQGWSFEEGSIRATPGGKKRVRIRG